jgi:hypothetical protein
VCVVCGTVWIGFGGVSVCCVWDSLDWVWGVSVCCVWYSLEWVWEVSVCCVWDSLDWVWGSKCVLCVGQFGLGLGSECAAGGYVVGVCVSALCDCE